MRRIRLLLVLASLCAGCEWPDIGEGIVSLVPTSDLPVAATAALPDWGMLDSSVFTQQIAIVGTVTDRYGAGVAGVVICYGPNFAEAVAIGMTDSAGAYTATPPHSFSGTSGNHLWAYLPLYRFEPDCVQVGILIAENTQDFKAYPDVYPVPPERDCR